MAATTKKLDYGSVPPRATSSRAIRSEVTPSNGQTFNMSDTIIFDCPNNLNNTFADFQSSYVKLNLANNNGSNLNFTGGGFPSAIKRITLELGGMTMATINEYGVLYEMMISLDTSINFRNNQGQRLFGSNGGSSVGAQVGNGASRQICFPLVLTPLVGASKYFPLIGRDRLRIRIELDTAARGLISADGGLTDAQVAITDVALVMYNLELGSDVMSQIVSASGGSFKIAMPSFQHHQANLATTDTTLVATLGFSMSSLNRILVAQQRSADDPDGNNTGNRARLRLQRFFISIGGVKYPQRDLRDLSTAGDLGAGAEPLAEALVSQRALVSYSHDSSIALGGGFSAVEPSGADNANTGSFLIDLDLESQRIAGGEGSQLVAGVNCIGQVVQATFEYAVAPTNAHVINIYGEHTIMCMLDLNTLTWSVAV